jgi:hypothetical protein
MTFNTSFRFERCANYVKLYPCDMCDLDLFDRLKKTGKEVFVGEIGTPVEAKTLKQLGTVFKLIEVIFRSQNDGRKPTKQERYQLYDDLLEEYGDRRVSTIDPDKTIAIRLSESDTIPASHFIQQLINLLANECSLNVTEQTEVREVFRQWEEWRGMQEKDPVDDVTEREWYAIHTVSEASGQGGTIEKCHIVSRGADNHDIEETWNWTALTHEEHMEQHQYGWVAFLKKYPHLAGKVKRARILAHKIELLNA